MNLVDDWKQVWKWFSVQGLAALAVALILYDNFGIMQDYLPPNAFHVAMGVLGALSIIGRVVKQ